MTLRDLWLALVVWRWHAFVGWWRVGAHEHLPSNPLSPAFAEVLKATPKGRCARETGCPICSARLAAHLHEKYPDVRERLRRTAVEEYEKSHGAEAKAALLRAWRDLEDDGEGDA